ncbi:hypothetical protein CABS01_08069 [Colletotrichum abscissum]|uniref:uncharacterized protein n=1 Tax=Colletotrichum abscissum TaxID=1671311 RepID=UPI0027D4DC5A|nr:uncharacterized protein CABS01_08069 [Colletotrichum abscissum]KAK1508839.1 hypothetical protein CABS01_08069 [Colletotrichum abscissum]
MNTSIFIEKGPAIQIAARACDDQLHDMIQITHRGKTALRELQQRFLAWANNSGVFAEPQLCLDARLSGHKPPQLIILKMLKLIQRNLETARSNTIIVQEGKPETRSGGRFQETAVQLNHTEQPGRDLDIKYLNSAFKGISGAVERLNRVAALISKSSKSSRPARVEEFIRRNPKDSETETLITVMVSSKFQDIPGLLKKQLIRSMIYRIQRLDYECDRRERVYNTHAGEDHTSVWHDDEKASTYHQSIFNEGYPAMQSERTSSISTAATATETEIQYPRQPKAETSEDITRKSQSQRNMEIGRINQALRVLRRHVDEDVEPFVCISEKCAYPPQTFAKLTAWRTHMETEHGLDWMHHAHRPQDSEHEQKAVICFMCKQVIPEQEPQRGQSAGLSEPVNTTRTTIIPESPTPNYRRRQVQFADDNKESRVAPESRLKGIEVTRTHSSQTNLASHIASHLQSLCYQSISIGVDDEDTEDEDIEEEGTEDENTEDEGTKDEGTKDEGTKVSDNTEGGVAEGENERSSSDGLDRSSGQGGKEKDVSVESQKRDLHTDTSSPSRSGQRNEFRATDVIFHRYGNVRVLQKILLHFGIPKTDINIRV